MVIGALIGVTAQNRLRCRGATGSKFGLLGRVRSPGGRTFYKQEPIGASASTLVGPLEAGWAGVRKGWDTLGERQAFSLIQRQRVFNYYDIGHVFGTHQQSTDIDAPIYISCVSQI